LVGAGGAPRLIYILEVHEVFFGDIAEDILEHENLPDEPDIALGRVLLRRFVSRIQNSWVQDSDKMWILKWELED